MNATRENQTRNRLIVFFVLAYAITFLLGWLGTLASPPLPAAARSVALVLFHYGPALAAVIVALATGSLAALLKPLGKWRVGVQWYLFVFFFPLLVRLLARWIEVWLGGTPPPFFVAGENSGVPADVHPLVLLLPVWIGVLLQAGLAEEIGWRGFALPRLQSRYNAFVSSLILGILWTLWHYDPLRAPEVLDKGLWYPLAVLPMTMLMTWVYNGTGGSLLLVVLYHTASNTADWIVPTVNLAGAEAVVGMRPFTLQVGIMWLAAIAVIAVLGTRDLARRPRTAIGP